MTKRILAQKTVSAVGLGCMGMSEFYGATDEAESLAVLHRALELGVDHFDTADMYGDGANEVLLGRAFAAHPRRDDLLVATKCGIARDPGNPSSRIIDNSPEYIRGAWARSRDRLGTRIDLYYLHRITDRGAHIETSMAAMGELLNEGKIGGAGISEAKAETIRRAHAALLEATGGRHGLAAVQTEFSLMSRDVEINDVLATCDELGIALVAYSPIGRGLLSGRISKPDDLAGDDIRRTLPRFSADAIGRNAAIAARIAEVAEELGATSSQVAIAWVLTRSPRVHAIPGTKRIAYLEENRGAADLVLSPEILARIDAVLEANPVAGTRYTPEMMKAYGMDVVERV